MKYTKPPLNFNQQAKLLIGRGLIADEGDLEEFLSCVNYYRFSGYLYPFRQLDNDNYNPGTTLNQSREIYYFDSELRGFTLSAIEVVDIAILRTKMVEMFTLSCGPFCYSEKKNFAPNMSTYNHQRMIQEINDNFDRSKEEFVQQYRTKYTSETQFPFWMVAEVSTLGQLSMIFRYLPKSIQVPLANQINLHSRDLISWLHMLTVTRNICAHHSRLWNRILPVKPAVPSKRYHPEFYLIDRINNDSYFVVLAILYYLLDEISPGNYFRGKFLKLLDKYPGVPINKLGFPKNWQEYPIFKQ